MLVKQGEEVSPVFVDYGQLAAVNEWTACKRTFEISDLPTPEKVDVRGYGEFFKSGITDESLDIRKEAFLPGRNLLLLLIGSSFAHQRGITNVAIGLLSEATHLFPDQTQEFIVNANFALNSALGSQLSIATPLINFTKKDIVRLAKEYEIPLSETYSCHLGEEKYCGRCIACLEIIGSVGKASFPQFEDGGD